MKFTKMHGSGNDYIYVNGFEEKVEYPSAVSKFISDRHKGIGSDGLVLILPSQKADLLMRMFNADGSEGLMCGNAIRCVAKYGYEHGLVNKEEITIETLSGIKTLWLTIDNGKVLDATVNMGEPVLTPRLIPMNADGDDFIDREVEVMGKKLRATAVSMGNPHWVFFVDDVYELELHKIGPAFENHELFPERVNTEFLTVKDGVIHMRVWERGSGETMACGTGACAALVASVLNNKCGAQAKVKLLGGELDIRWNKSCNTVYMRGDAVHVFDGEIDIEGLK